MPTCRKCHKAFSNTLVIDGISHNICNRTMCVECLPFKSKESQDRKHSVSSRVGEPHWCTICGKQIKRQKGYRCGACSIKIRRILAKKALVQFLGGSCTVCGYNADFVALEFHHTVPGEKEFNLGTSLNKSFDVLKEEARKCILLCANCHSIEHSDRNNKTLLEAVQNYKGRLLQR